MLLDSKDETPVLTGVHVDSSHLPGLGGEGGILVGRSSGGVVITMAVAVHPFRVRWVDLGAGP